MNDVSNCNVVEHPLAKAILTALRDRQTSLWDFRRALHQLSVLVGIEATRDLGVCENAIDTPLAPCKGHKLTKPIVIIPILRAGLGMVEALLTFLPDACVGHIGLYRDDKTFIPQNYYFKTPALEDAEVFLVDPMLATGHTAADAITQLKSAGARRLRIVALIGAKAGIEWFYSKHPDVPIYLAAIDLELNEKAYIVPGLGDAGDRYFGT